MKNIFTSALNPGLKINQLSESLSITIHRDNKVYYCAISGVYSLEEVYKGLSDNTLNLVNIGCNYGIQDIDKTKALLRYTIRKILGPHIYGKDFIMPDEQQAYINIIKSLQIFTTDKQIERIAENIILMPELYINNVIISSKFEDNKYILTAKLDIDE